ncbi:hypothetical protein BDY17DRAFT_323512 [Neohortaea acidophila]|uniref:Uncharacterized protein n=1 Tax=Neohortaea acidophila TaxID=245834 RepID=A0A6A6PY32_9PEZI|nr:uncharacterized protein BDY17DRAFT_323512 [Neohortaea acidophila]KAF2484676.1 hypothetical protein BDY17DRAFT_323512 [Neohortaea acidophila]
MAQKGMTWDPAADRKLLLGILKLQNISVDFAAMAKYMATDGQVCTAGAVQNRLKKLKAMARDGVSGDDEATPKAKKTPKKRGAADDADDESPTKKAKGGAKGKGGKAKVTEVEDDVDDEEVEMEEKVKEEEVEDDFDDEEVEMEEKVKEEEVEDDFEE